jgi:hypothetical protein
MMHDGALGFPEPSIHNYKDRRLIPLNGGSEPQRGTVRKGKSRSMFAASESQAMMTAIVNPKDAD